MPSIIDGIVQRQESFRAEYRLVYLRSIGAHMGYPDPSLRAMAFREAKAMLELAEALPKE